VPGSRRNGVEARTTQSIVKWVTDHSLTHVINAAAECGGIGLNQRSPASLWAATTHINAAVLEAAELTKLSKLVMLGTVCSYACDAPTPFKESDLMRHGFPEATNSAYGVAKLSGLFGAQAYRAQYGLNVVYLLPVNLYGPHDNFDPTSSHVIPALIRKAIAARDAGAGFMEVWGSGKASREFLFVEDAAHGILMAAAEYDSPDPINLGSGREITIRDLATKIAELCGFQGELVFDASKPDGQPRRCLDVSRALEHFGFIASTSLDEGLKRTIAWWEAQNVVN
jgi:GDP-L-fucose synthase